MGVYRIHDGGAWSAYNTIGKKNISMDNAYNIYLVENDKRAFHKILRIQYDILLLLKKTQNKKEYRKKFVSFYKMDPLNIFAKLLWKISRFNIWSCYHKVKNKTLLCL